MAGVACSRGASAAAPDTALTYSKGAWIDAETPWASPSVSIVSARTANLLLEAWDETGMVVK